ncbi:hypothetical protein [Paenibacillus albus]|uniref:Uncharacterized protein n=1 Tax=Paenibacillus albus TaxID=2495582 RepID=A0A3S9A3X4_9BACL|nr:hypothetical protein [Paenibacillus albus]AZN40412.1 hypothetical protein EJC50_12690 [Paenibacillus albus]
MVQVYPDSHKADLILVLEIKNISSNLNDWDLREAVGEAEYFSASSAPVPFHFERDSEKQNRVADGFRKAVNLRAPKGKKRLYLKTFALKCGITVNVLENNMRKEVPRKIIKMFRILPLRRF